MCVCHSLDPAVDIQFCHQSLDVIAHSRRADMQVLGHCVRRQPMIQKAQDFPLPLRQQAEAVGSTPGRSLLTRFAVATQILTRKQSWRRFAMAAPHEMNHPPFLINRRRNQHGTEIDLYFSVFPGRDTQGNGLGRGAAFCKLAEGAVWFAESAATGFMALQDFVAAASYGLKGGNTCQVFAAMIPANHLLIAVDGKHGVG